MFPRLRALETFFVRATKKVYALFQFINILLPQKMFLARANGETLSQKHLKAMLHGARRFLETWVATNVALQVARKLSRVTSHFLQPAMQQNVALRVARKVGLSSTFRNIARQVAACDLHIVTKNAIL